MNIKRNILLNPGPATTSDEVKMAMLVSDVCPREKEFCDLMDSIKNDLLLVINADDDYTAVMFASSGTGAVEATISTGIPKNGKLLIIENGAYGTRMRNIAERYNIPFISHKREYGDYPDLSQIKYILDTEPEITHVSIVDHETTTGMRNPVQEVCDIAHSKKIEVIVDCMSSFAGLPINLQQWRAEYIISSSNKCLQGMAGLSFIIFQKKLLDKIKNNARSYYFDLYAQYTGFSNNGQMLFTPPVQIVYALRKALDLFFIESAEGRIRRYRNNYKLLHEGLKMLNFDFLLEDKYQSGILIAVKEPINLQYSFTEMHDYLFQQGFTIYPGKGAKEATFRLSILGDLYQDDIKKFLEAMAEYLRYAGIKRVNYY